MGAVMQRMLARIGKTILKQSQEIQDSHFLTTQLLLIYTGGLGAVGGLCVGAITELNQVRCIKLSTQPSRQPSTRHILLRLYILRYNGTRLGQQLMTTSSAWKNRWLV